MKWEGCESHTEAQDSKSLAGGKVNVKKLIINREKLKWIKIEEECMCVAEMYESWYG